MSLTQIVENDDSFSPAYQLTDGVRADVSGATGD
jgi:hypothetical protein